MKALKIRVADVLDAEALLAIYAPYVRETAISFETEVPTLATFRRRITGTLARRYPFLVAEADGEILGYAYTGPFVGRAAYDWAAEVSIYVRQDAHGQGVGRALYEALEEVSRAQHIINLEACIGVPSGEDDDYLTHNSAEFHAHMGYRLVGRFERCGYKFGRWYDMVWMEKIIGEHVDNPAPVVPFSKLRERH